MQLIKTLRKPYLLMAALFSLTLLISSCRREGCTDSAATNFDSDANHDDGSCVYLPGTVTLPCANISSDMILEKTGGVPDYIINCDIAVEAVLTIKPGVVIEFTSTGSLSTYYETGAINAVGTALEPIIFKGTQDVAGSWKGLYFTSNHVLNELTYCVVTGGGSASFDGNTTFKSNIRVNASARLAITNTTVSKSAKDGLFVPGISSSPESPISSFASNTFTSNVEYPVNILAGSIKNMDGTGSTFTSNGKQFVLIRGGKMIGDHTWKKMNVPYLVQDVVAAGDGSTVGNLVIQPGTTVKFGTDAALILDDYSSGYIKSIGTSTEPITLTGEFSVAGAWKGICFQSNNPLNEIAFTNISYGGSSAFTGNNDVKGNVVVGAWSAGTLNIHDATITNSQACGIFTTTASTLNEGSNVTYSNNALGTSCQ